MDFDVLSKCDLFDGIKKENIKFMLSCLSPEIFSYKKGDIVALAGEPFEKLGILLSGQASIVKETASGNRIIVNILRPSDMFAEMIVYSSHSILPATVIAQKDSKILFFHKQSIITPCKKTCPWHKNLVENMLKIVSEKAILLNKQLEYLSIKGIRAKISTYLLEQFKLAGKTTFTISLNRNELADFLNVSRPSMSREISRMKKEGIIDFHLSSFKILDLDSLKKLSS